MTLHEIYAGAWQWFVDGWLFGASFIDADERPDDRPDEYELSYEARTQLRCVFREACKACHSDAPLVHGDNLDRFGLDLAMTLQGHGAGLWDGGWPHRGAAWTDAVRYLKMDGFVHCNRRGTLEIL